MGNSSLWRDCGVKDLDSKLSRAICCGTADQVARALGELDLTFQSKGGVNCAVYVPQTRAIVAGDETGEVKIWDLVTGQLQMCLSGSSPVNAVAYIPEVHAIASGDDDGQLRVWDMVTGTSRLVMYPGTLPVTSLIYVPELKSIITASSGHGIGNITILDALTGAKTLKLLCAEPLSSIAYVTELQAVAAANDILVTLWDRATGAKLWEAQDDHLVVAVIFVEGLRAILSGNSSGRVALWEVQDGRKRHEISCGDGGVLSSMAYAPDFQAVLVAGNARVVRAYAVATGALLQTLTCGYSVHSIVYAETLQSVILSHHLEGRRLSSLVASGVKTGMVKILPLNDCENSMQIKYPVYAGL